MSREVEVIEKEIEKLERFDPAEESKQRYEGIVKGLNEALNLVKSVDIELNPNQQVVLELLQKAYAKNKWVTPFGAVFSVANENDFAIRAWLNKEEQFKVLAAFAEWGNKSNE